MPRPVFTFHDFVGHKMEVDVLRRQADGAKRRSEPFPATLFLGPSGAGKTMLAKSLATEFGTALTVAYGNESVAELSQKLVQLNVCDFAFVDEAHVLAPKAQELFYHVLDDYRIPKFGTEGGTSASEATSFTKLTPCTILFGTDQPGKLLNALHKRIELRISLGYYGLREMREIVDRMATDLNLLVSPQVTGLMADIAGGLPRRARQLLQLLRRHFPDSEQHQISVDQVRNFLKEFQIDGRGLGPDERRYLQHLNETGKASLESLSLYLGMDSEFVRRQMESQLQRLGFIAIGSGGRRLTDAGREWITKPT